MSTSAESAFSTTALPSAPSWSTSAPTIFAFLHQIRTFCEPKDIKTPMRDGDGGSENEYNNDDDDDEGAHGSNC